MNFSFDIFDRVEKPILILQNANGEKIGALGYSFNIKFSLKYNDISTLEFTYPQQVESVSTPLYDQIKGNKIIYVPNIGRFKLSNPKISSDGIREAKDCQAYSLEYELDQKDITQFSGTYPLYDPISPQESILGIIVDNIIPSWSIGTVDSTLYGIYRTFDVNKQKLYAFLTQDVSKAFECVFTFDTFNKKINATSIYNLSGDTNIFISFDNLMKNCEIEELTDQVITKLHVYGGNDMSIHGVNPNGTDAIYNYDYYMTTEWMSSGLITALTNYKTLYNNLQPTYANYLTQLKDKNDLLLQKQTELTDLESQMDSLINIKQSRIQANLSYSDINSQINTLQQSINSKNNEINTIQNTINSLEDSLSNINNQLNFNKYFTKSQLNELDSLTYEDTYQTNDFIITDSMSNSEVQDQEQALFDYAKRLLNRVSQPRFSFKINSINFMFLKDYMSFTQQLSLGSYITVSLRSDNSYIVKPILLQIDFNFEDETEFSLTFGNRTRLDSNEFYFSDLLNQSITSGTTVSFEKYTYNDWQNNKDDVTTFINSALDASKNAVISSSDQNVVIDEHGIQCRQKDSSTGQFKPEQLWIVNNMIAMSKDGFNTADIAIGKIQDSRYGSIWGIAAPLLAGRMLVGNNLRIENSANQFILDESGCRLNNASFTLTTSNNKGKIILDASQGIKVQGNSGGSFVDKFYVNTNGDLIFAGTLSGANGTFSGTLQAATITGSIISGGTISGTTITGSTISGGTINVSTNINVGDKIYIGDQGKTWGKGIIFSNDSSIYTADSSSSMIIESPKHLELKCGDGYNIRLTGGGFTTTLDEHFSIFTWSDDDNEISCDGDGDININTNGGDINLNSASDIHINADRIGFFGKEPVEQQTAQYLPSDATLSAVIAKINGLLLKLDRYGLFYAYD